MKKTGPPWVVSHYGPSNNLLLVTAVSLVERIARGSMRNVWNIRPRIGLRKNIGDSLPRNAWWSIPGATAEPDNRRTNGPYIRKSKQVGFAGAYLRYLFNRAIALAEVDAAASGLKLSLVSQWNPCPAPA